MITVKNLSNKRFLLIHFRVGKTDGVSLEIDSWKRILQKKGAIVALCAGPESIGADYIIEDLEQQFNSQMYNIEQDCFQDITKHKCKEDLEKDILKHQEIIEKEFEKVVLDYKPTHILISNIFSVGEGIPVAGAFAKVLDRYEIPTMLVNHDFYWEDKKKRHPSCDLVREQLERYFPIDREYIQNYCINKIAQEELLKRKNISSKLLHDTFDFTQTQWSRKKHIADYLQEKGVDENSIIVLQATRVVRRKCIEIAIDLVKQLEQRKDEIKGKLYNGKNFDKSKSKFHLVLSGYVEKRDKEYLEELRRYAKDLGIYLTYFGDDIDERYSLFDIYPFADIITYPSQYEGFGNQVLEAVFARKPIVLFEYPTFKTDILNTGIRYISLGDRMRKKREENLFEVGKGKLNLAVSEVFDVLQNKEKYDMYTDNSFDLVSKHFSFEKVSKIFDEFVGDTNEIQEDMFEENFTPIVNY